MSTPCIDYIAAEKNSLALRVIDENADVYIIKASGFSRIKGYVKFDLNVSVSYCNEEQTLSEPFSMHYKATYDREAQIIKVAFGDHVTQNPYPSFWDCVQEYLVAFIKECVKNGNWKWRRKYNP